ncbi:sigma-54-dependent Fis family transcriptional regulator [Rhodopseudomonas sp. BR0M22]|uniref:sigma-54-dependent Fis family transcriptional regulator n=1 Tax=Rhodopseudomonas sp. BR0M22 TaxID=2269369 RepID=UPI0013E08AF3|nr:sigma-54-dependent Fis family transcriptional regulator [Rhodopseudomonas sp. BR0M22]NEW90955.1 sigma-54-dependent Fis family transcriptional regulator [Rhodopseudomonas sp. BR0M22]
MSIASSRDAVVTARRRFFGEGRSVDGMLAAPILRSWQRCAGQGLDVSRSPLVEPPTARELRELHERHDRLGRLARPELNALQGDARLTGSVVILTDAAGVVLDMIGDGAFAGRAAQVALRPGVSWSEADTGTNAIGTALVERQPIAVHGAEHFFERHRILACAAAPLIDPRGRVAGALDMTGPAAIRHVHALGLMRLAAEQIEHRFFSEGFERCTMLRLHTDRALLGTPREGVLAFADGILVGANRHGLDLMNLDWPALDLARLETLLPGVRPSEQIQMLRGPRGTRLWGRLIEPPRRSSRVPAAAAVAAPAPASPAGEVEPILDAEMMAQLSRAVRLVEAGIPVLLLGETGSGKDVFARRVHAESARRSKPFVPVNCAALPEGLIESELFGYEAGAFTGARRQGAPGLLRQADGGVLFLDEIGDMPLSLQSRLLRVLQDKQISPLGGGRPVPVDFALICATHQPLGSLLAAGRFRQDLYFRIAQYVVERPPVRHHPDRLALVRTLWRQLGAEEAGVQLSAEVESVLAAYNWPGNYRQLVGTLRALLVLGEPGHPVEVSALPAEIGAAASACDSQISVPPMTSLAEHTRSALQAALEASGGNVSRAARRLGIDRSTYYRRLLKDKDRG